MPAKRAIEPTEVDPHEFLRELLKIKPEDAAAVREDAAKAMEHDDSPGTEPTSEKR